MLSESVVVVGVSLTPELSDAGSIQDEAVVRRMVALFDYDPWESSPNVDSDVSQRHFQSSCFHFNLLRPFFSDLYSSILTNRLSWASVQETSYMC